MKEGGTSRRAAIEKALQGLGGRIESFYFGFGEGDVYVIADMPDNVSAASASLSVGAAGGARAKTIVLLTPEEMDEASRKSVEYRPPGA